MPLNLILPIPPIPFQLVNESRIEAIVGMMMKTTRMKVGIDTIAAMVSLSRVVSRL